MTAPAQQHSLFPDLVPAAHLPAAAAPVLNSEQQAVVDHRGSPLLVAAGAGTGKTRTLVHRLVSLLNDGVRPYEILMLTFSNSAAAEMRRRAALLVKDAELIRAGTYHAVALRLLRSHGRLAGLLEFEVIDRAEADSLLTHLKNSLNLARDFPKSRKVSSLFSAAANMSRELADLISADARLAPHLGGLYQLHDLYTRYKIEHSLADYDDLLLHLDDLLFLPEARRAICAPLRHILVDEFQDTNRLQLSVLQNLASEGAQVTAVGDDAQSIYAFRGADSSIMRYFPQHFPGCRVLALSINYRSAQPILDVANAVMQDASYFHGKALQSVFQGGVRPTLRVLPTERVEGEHVASRIVSLLSQGTPPEHVAVLYRSSVHALPLEMRLNSLRIPYIKRGGLRLTDAAHVKDLLALLRLAFSSDQHSRRRLLLILPGIKDKTADKILSGQQVPAKAVEAVSSLDSCVAAMRASLSPGEACSAALSWYQPHLERLHNDFDRRLADLHQVREQFASCHSLRSALDSFSLDGQSQEEDGKGKVTLSTIHWAKGREFPHVFVIGLSDGRFSVSRRGTPDYEEDRRKLYVALTRAKDSLELTAPRSYLGPDFAPRTASVSSLLDGVPRLSLPFAR